MKSFKTFDFIIQAILITAALLWHLSGNRRMFDDDSFFTSYFLVGGWQVLSVIIHFFYAAPYSKRPRKIYLVALAAVILIALFSLPFDGILQVLLGLLFVSPVMALYYLWVCIWETRQLNSATSTA